MRAADPAPGGGAGEDVGQFIHDFIDAYLDVFDNNNLGFNSHAKAWDGFLLGFSSGADDLYQFWKRHIGEFHWTPAEAFALGAAIEQAPGAEPPESAPAVKPEELTVVSWALCQTAETKSSNRHQSRFPSERWARARIYGERCNRSLHRAVVKALNGEGYEAVAPGMMTQWGERQSRQFGDASTWSQRHVAYVSGLGTFSLSGGLITERGQAHRLGSVVVRAAIPATVRPYVDPFEYCLYYTTGGCTDCVDRCPAGSIKPGARDKRACAKHLEPGTAEYVKEKYGFDGYGCGLCQTGVRCESRIPERPQPNGRKP